MTRDVLSPLVSDHDVTFLWQGAGRPPVVVGDWCDWDTDRGLAMKRRGGVSSATLRLPRNAYLEYRFFHRGDLVPDPLNPHRTRNGLGGVNSRVWMPGASRRALTLRRRRSPRGRVLRGSITFDRGLPGPRKRRFDLYMPPAVADPANLPLLLVLDGPDYLDRGGLHRTLDGLIGDRAMAPVAAAFLADAGPGRSAEYTASDWTLRTLAEVVVPAAIERLGLRPGAAVEGRGPVAILGASFGGVMALHAAVRLPDVFGTAIVQSYAVYPSPEWSTIALIRATPPPPVRLWLDVGTLEGLAEPVDGLVELLRERGFKLRYQPYPAGHNQTGWAESLVDALPVMFPAV